MLKYLGVAAIMAATFNLPSSLEAVVLILSLLATTFYIMAFRLFSGLSRAVLVDDANILQVITVHMIYITMAVIAFMGGYQIAVYIALPWLAIQGLINILTILIKLDIIGIQNK